MNNVYFFLLLTSLQFISKCNKGSKLLRKVLIKAFSIKVLGNFCKFNLTLKDYC